MTTINETDFGTALSVVEAYRLDRYDNLEFSTWTGLKTKL